METPNRSTRSVLEVVALVFLACAKSAVPEGAAQRVAVAVEPASTQVRAGGSVAFTAVVTGAVNVGVSWDVIETGGGSMDAAGLYTAPQTPGTFHVRASTLADPTVQTTAAVTVTAAPLVRVEVSPATGAVHSCQKLAFTATVTGASDSSVTWSVQEGASGGAIDASGNYTAPSAAGTYHVVATSQADPTESAVAQVNVTDQVLSVAVSPSTMDVAFGATAQFTATITTTCGTFAATHAIAAR